MTRDPPTGPSDGSPITMGAIWQAIRRPYPVTVPMVILVSLVPFYLVIAGRSRGSSVHAPELAFDRLLPLVPAWALVYGALYLFLIVLPVFVVQQPEMIRRTVWAYITVWTVGYACFLSYPTVAPRPDKVTGDGFAAWGLRFLYDADPPHNCFPSIRGAWKDGAFTYEVDFVNAGEPRTSGGRRVMSDTNRLYTDLAWLWPMWGDPAHEYAHHCRHVTSLIEQHAEHPAGSLRPTIGQWASSLSTPGGGFCATPVSRCMRHGTTRERMSTRYSPA